jgi:tRNA(Ile)-lysidine synthase
MIEEIAQYIQDEQLIPKKNSKILAAVSGGVDSVVLLDILYHLRERFSFNLEIVHFNHRVRGKAADADARFVEKLAEAYHVKIHMGQLDQLPQKVTETYLREKRYQFYKTYLKKDQAVLIATGHNRDDNIETFVMRLARGSGLKGLLSIPPRRDRFIRPLLQETRDTIVAYAKKRSLDFRQDDSNLENQIIRNKIRNVIIPYLQRELNLEIKENLNKSMTNFALYYDLFEKTLQQAIQQAVITSGMQRLLNRERYGKYLPLIKRGLIEYCILSTYPLNYNLSNKNFMKWDTFVTRAAPGKKFIFKKNAVAYAERTHILFGEVPLATKEQYHLTPKNAILIGNKLKLSMHTVSLADVKYAANPAVEYVDGDKSGSNLKVRFWRAGDLFKPLGLGHTKKVSDFFIDLKINIRIKKETPLVCKGDQIIWIAGYRLDDRFKISATTRRVYRLQMQKVDGSRWEPELKLESG